MSETLFGRQTLEILVRAVEHPSILLNAYDMATISIGSIIYVGEITNVQSKKIKDNDTDDIENWVIVRLAVESMTSVGDCTITFPGKNEEIMDKVIFNYQGEDDNSKAEPTNEEFNFNN